MTPPGRWCGSSSRARRCIRCSVWRWATATRSSRVPVAAGSQLEGRSLREANLELETGSYLLAIRRAGRYIYRPRSPVRLEAGDELIAIGPDDGRDRLAELAGFHVVEDDDTGEIELVRTPDAT